MINTHLTIWALPPAPVTASSNLYNLLAAVSDPLARWPPSRRTVWGHQTSKLQQGSEIDIHQTENIYYSRSQRDSRSVEEATGESGGGREFKNLERRSGGEKERERKRRKEGGGGEKERRKTTSLFVFVLWVFFRVMDRPVCRYTHVHMPLKTYEHIWTCIHTEKTEDQKPQQLSTILFFVVWNEKEL